jgi:cyclophilin family peptidyl-prolyl cis-trans isomerase
MAFCLLAVAACDQPAKQENTNQSPYAAAPSPTPDPTNDIAVVETDLGTIKIELFEKEAPKTVENFQQLAERGFYNGLIFHRVIRGFMIQGGDPKGDGSGGVTATGGRLPNEVNTASAWYRGGYRRGVVAMANKGGDPTTGTSQFFIMHQNRPLDAQYTIFGRVIEGMEVVDQIASAPTSPPANRPTSPVAMKRVTIIKA